MNSLTEGSAIMNYNFQPHLYHRKNRRILKENCKVIWSRDKLLHAISRVPDSGILRPRSKLHPLPHNLPKGELPNAEKLKFEVMKQKSNTIFSRFLTKDEISRKCVVDFGKIKKLYKKLGDRVPGGGGMEVVVEIVEGVRENESNGEMDVISGFI